MKLQIILLTLMPNLCIIIGKEDSRRLGVGAYSCQLSGLTSAWQPEGGRFMSEVKVKENETLDSALKRFKRSCAKAGIMGEVRKREHYDKPSVRRKKKSEAARKRKYN